MNIHDFQAKNILFKNYHFMSISIKLINNRFPFIGIKLINKSLNVIRVKEHFYIFYTVFNSGNTDNGFIYTFIF